MKKQQIIIILVVCMVALAACSQADSSPPDPVSQPPTRGIAEIESIEILNLAERPDQVRAAAHIQLPDTCTSLDNVDVLQSGNAFRITITTIREGTNNCVDRIVEIEHLIPLSDTGLPPGTYTVVVNDASSRFELAEEPTPVPVLKDAELEEGTAEESEEPVEPEAGSALDVGPEIVSTGQDSEQETTNESGSLAGEGTANDPEPVADQTACEEKVGFFGDVTVPDDTFFRQGETFTKSWKLRNEGTCKWDSGYALVFAGGNILNAPLTVPLPFQVEPGQIFELSLEMAAPAQGGTYISKWLFQNPKGEQFGMGASRQDVIYTRIVVGWINPGESSSGNSEEGSGAGQGGPFACDVGQDPSVEQELLGLINAERIGRGLRRLALEDRLSAAARGHSADMACSNFTDHTGSDGSTFKIRVEREGYSASYVAENIYYGGTAQDAFAWWMGSQVHKDNILNPNVTEIGIGFVSYPQSRWVRYYTLVFARP